MGNLSETGDFFQLPHLTGVGKCPILGILDITL